MCNLRNVLLILSFVFCATSTLAEENYAVSGSAYSLKNGKLVYRELFTKLDENNEVHVSYAKPDGTVFARKVLNYATEVFQPGVVFTDDRDDETVSATFDAGKLLLTHKVKGDSQTKTLYDTLKLVIDAGSDAFIQQSWNKLVAGKKVEYELADARHLGTEKLVIKMIDESATPLAYKGAAPTWKYFRVDTANKLSSVFSQPIYYAYEPEGKFLMRYQGRANIDSDTGDFWEVRVEYEYW